MEKRELFKNIFMCLRIVIYILIIYTIISLINNSTRFNCNWNDKYGIYCPGCGATRATLSIIQGQYINALKYNAIYTIVIFPLMLIFIIDDILIIIGRILKNTRKSSFLEIIFELDGEENYG